MFFCCAYIYKSLYIYIYVFVCKIHWALASRLRRFPWKMNAAVWLQESFLNEMPRAHLLGPRQFFEIRKRFSYISHNSKSPWSHWEPMSETFLHLKAAKERKKNEYMYSLTLLGHAPLSKCLVFVIVLAWVYFQKRRMFKFIFPSFIYVFFFFFDFSICISAVDKLTSLGRCSERIKSMSNMDRI